MDLIDTLWNVKRRSETYDARGSAAGFNRYIVECKGT